MSIKRLSQPLRPRKLLVIAFAIFLAIAFVAFLLVKRYVYSPILNLKSEVEYVCIPTGSDFNDVLTILSANDRLADADAFCVMSSLMSYSSNVKPGRYKLTPKLSARSLVSELRGGRQSSIRVTFNSVRSVGQLAGVVAQYVEADSLALISAMSDSSILASVGFNRCSAPALFLPDTYDVWWTISPRGWVDKMASEYHKFWNSERLAKADSLGLSPVQVATLASIVEEESNILSDQKIIAGLYLNRLKIGMPMQACPTIKYALGDFSIRRISYQDTQVQSPYNTYINQGLPPGPIRISSKKVIDAVLNPTESKYLYMCARPDGSGLHDFSRTLAEHQRSANKYHRLLNNKNIYR